MLCMIAGFSGQFFHGALECFDIPDPCANVESKSHIRYILVYIISD